MMKQVSILASLLFIINLNASSQEQKVKDVVNTMFTAMKTSDTALLKSVFHAGTIFQTIIKDSTGNVSVRNERVERFIQSIGRAEAGSLDERISFGEVKVDDVMAIAWTPYEFYYKGQFSHCGVNCFQLVQLNGVWKINYIIDTRRKQDCK